MGNKVSSIIDNLVPGRREEKFFDPLSRSKWGARVPRWREDLEYPALSLTLVYTQSPSCKTKAECIQAVRDLQNKHMDEDGLPDIEYSFIVGGDGTVFEGRGWHTLSNRRKVIKCVDPEYPVKEELVTKAEARRLPSRMIVVGLLGYEGKDEATEIMKKAVTKLVNYGINNYLLESKDPRPEDRDGSFKRAMEEVDNDAQQDDDV